MITSNPFAAYDLVDVTIVGVICFAIGLGLSLILPPSPRSSHGVLRALDALRIDFLEALVFTEGRIMTLLQRLQNAIAQANAETNTIATEIAGLKAQLADAAANQGLSATDAGALADQLDALTARLQGVAGDTPTDAGSAPTPALEPAPAPETPADAPPADASGAQS